MAEADDDQQRLSILLGEIEKLHQEFNLKSSAWTLVFAPNLLHVSDALRKVLELAELVPQVCPKDRAAYWKHEVDFTNGVIDEAFQKLKKASHVAYVAIQSQESALDTEQATVKKTWEVTQDMAARLEKIEGESDSFLKSMKSLQAESELILAQKVESRKEAQMRYSRAEADAWATEERIRKKREVNSNIFSGIKDWFSRSDDQFDLALSLGIGEDQEREKGRQTMAHHKQELNEEAASLKSANEALLTVNAILARVDEAKNVLSSTANRTQAFKTQAAKTSKKLAERKDALQQVATKLSDVENTMQRMDEDTRLPTVAQMSTEILGVLKASAEYQKFESGLVSVNKDIWSVLAKNTDWQASFDEDEELEPLYREVKALLE